MQWGRRAKPGVRRGLIAVALGGLWLPPGRSWAPPPAAAGPTPDEVVAQESQALPAAAKALLDFAEDAEKAGCGGEAAWATTLAAGLFPGDELLAEMAERRGTLPDPEGGIPEAVLRARATTATRVGRLLVRWADWLVGNGSPAVAEWAYARAAEIGAEVPTRKLDAVREALAPFQRAVASAQGTLSRDGGFGTDTQGGYRYIFLLPSDWSPDRSWPVLFVFHGSGGGWGMADDDEIGQIQHWPHFSQGGFIVASLRIPEMLSAQPPNEGSVVRGMEAVLGALAVRYRADPRRVGLSAEGSGALCLWPYFRAHPERVAALESAMGKYYGISFPKGHPATRVPVRIGLDPADNPNQMIGGHPASEHDQVHIDMMRKARADMERMGFERLEWVEDDFEGRDLEWFRRAIEERAPRYEEGSGGGARRRPAGSGR